MRNWVGPKVGKLIFRLRVSLRVNWLYSKIWWKENVSFRTPFSALWRPFWLAVIGIGLPFALARLVGIEWADVIEKFPLNENPSWRDLAQPLLILVGLPAAFILWLFRNSNAQANLENQRKDINLKEFQEIQLRAAGAIDEKFSQEARETLQVAAIHQLRPFLRGEYGDSFRRPAWELLRARLEASAINDGTLAAVGAKSFGPAWIQGPAEPQRQPKSRDEVKTALQAIPNNPISAAARDLLRNEVHNLFRKTYFDLSNSRLDGVNLQGAVLAQSKHSIASLVGANLLEAHLEGTLLQGAYLQGATLRGCYLDLADLRRARLESVDLQQASAKWAQFSGSFFNGAILSDGDFTFSDFSRSNFDQTIMTEAKFVRADFSDTTFKDSLFNQSDLQKASFRNARFENTKFMESHLQKSNFVGARLINCKPGNAEFSDAVFDKTTQFAADWHKLSDEKKCEAKQPFIDAGMVLLDRHDKSK